jgi:xylulokinase
MGDVTVGIDIGTTSVKAVAVDGDGTVLARTRVRHVVASPAPDLMQHDPDVAWRADVLQAYDAVRTDLRAVTGSDAVAAVNVSAMVPSLCAVDADGHALTPGLLYGDARGGRVSGANPSESGEVVNELRWCATAAPEAAGFWPAQAMANHALCGVAGLDTVTAMTTVPLFDYTGWDESVAADAGARTEQLPRLVPGSDALGHTPDGAVVGGGTIDAFAEQLVAGADHEGDVLVILGATLITWAVLPEWREVPGLWTVPHTAPGLTLIGGASNAGGLFLDWAQALVGGPGGAGGPVPAPVDPGAEAVRRSALHPERIPVWEPYVRGERTPLHDTERRAVLHDLDLTHGAAEVRQAAFEASAFVVRHHLDLAEAPARRIVVTGGGVRVAAWVQAIADATRLPVDVVAVPEGAALGAAFLARVTAGLEEPGAAAGRWARTARRVEPDPAWVAPMDARYGRFRAYAASGRKTGA